MHKKRRVYMRWGHRRLKLRRQFFQRWALAHRLQMRARLAVKRKYLVAWRDEVRVMAQLRAIELKLFRDAEMQAELPKIVMNLVFTSAAECESSSSATGILRSPLAAATTALTRKPTTRTFVDTAFASVAQVPDAAKRRVQHIRVLHAEARRAVVKKIVQRTFLLWKRVHLANKRVGLNAQLCIKRAARLAFGARPMWVGEKLLLVFNTWARWAAFTRCKRTGAPLPHFPAALPQWDVWVYNHQERHVRKIKALARAPLARMRRSFRRLESFCKRAVTNRRHEQLATQHHSAKLSRVVLLEWRDAIAERARNKKRVRRALLQLHTYARVKATLRPRKRAVQQRKQYWAFAHAWRAWKSVHLRSFFKRELNVSRLEQSAWRSKVHRIIDVWMDAKHRVNRWRTFAAWRDLCRKRRLFQTLRFHCARVQRRHVLFAMLNAWKAFVWQHEDAFLEDRLQLSAWDAYIELAPFFPKLFYGCYSAAAAIFGGVELRDDDDDSDSTIRNKASADAQQLARLPYSRDGIQQFQSTVTQGSVADVRNVVLRSKHLINAVDDATGNTALHVVMHVDDPTHRIDVLSMLLSEGAATWHCANRHGLTPAQLAPDNDARLLLERGIYDYYAHKVLQLRRAARSSISDNDDASAPRPANNTRDGGQRLVWCMVALMSSEWVRGLRLAGDVKVREWHSVLKDELWLRQERIIFASTSAFSPAILRCRAFLNGMKKKLARSSTQLLAPLLSSAIAAQPSHRMSRAIDGDALTPLPVRRSLSRTLHSRGSLRGQQHIAMLTRIVDASDQCVVHATADETARLARAKELGDLEPYARFLLTPTLDVELAEKALVHTFVGVIFSLDVALSDVLDEAFRLDDVCAELEARVSSAFDAVERAQWRVTASVAMGPTDPALLCCFATESDMDVYFTKRLLLLRLADCVARARQDSEGASDSSNAVADNTSDAAATAVDPDDAHVRETLVKELSALTTKLQRRMRKVEKKEKTLEQLIHEGECAYRATLVAAAKSVQAITNARMALERARLHMTSVLLKRSELQSELASVRSLQRHIVSGGDWRSLPLQDTAIALDDVDAIAQQRAALELEAARCMQAYRTKALYAVADRAASSASSDTAAAATTDCLDVRRLYKDAKTALRLLFIANLFRCCVCWLAENMAPPPHTGNGDMDDDAADAVDEIDALQTALIAADDKRRVRTQTLSRDRAPSTSRRRSSVTSSRKLVETLQRASIVTETAERDAVVMLGSYANSAALLFETERSELLALEQQRQLEQQSRVVEIVRELNPVTGLPETPPAHLLDLQVHMAREVASSRGDLDALPARRNRKREELRKAMVEHQLQRVADADARDVHGHKADSSDDSDDGGDRARGRDAAPLPSIHGRVVEFGNFVSSASLPVDPTVRLHLEAKSASGVDATAPLKSVEAMWKRGAQANESSSSSGATAPTKAAKVVETFASAEEEAAFSESFRVLSASRDRKGTATRLSYSAPSALVSDAAAQVLSTPSDERRRRSARTPEAAVTTSHELSMRSRRSSVVNTTPNTLGEVDEALCLVEASAIEQTSPLGYGRIDDLDAECTEQDEDATEDDAVALAHLASDEQDHETQSSCGSDDASCRPDSSRLCAEAAAIESPDLSMRRPKDERAADDVSALQTDALEAHLEQMRAAVAQSEHAVAPSAFNTALSPSATTTTASKDHKTQRPHRSERHLPRSDSTGDAFAAGSRFLSFIKWEKPETSSSPVAAAMASATPLPHIFQDAAVVRTSAYSQEERDVRQAQRGPAMRVKKRTDAVVAPVAASAVSSAALESAPAALDTSDLSSLALHGKSAVLTESRKRPSVRTNEDALQASRGDASTANEDDASCDDAVSAVPRISITVIQATAATERAADATDTASNVAKATLVQSSPPFMSKSVECEAACDPTTESKDTVTPLQLAGRGMAPSRATSFDAQPSTSGNRHERPKQLASSTTRAPKWPFQERPSAALTRHQSEATAFAPLHLDGTRTGSAAVATTGSAMSKSQSTTDVKPVRESSVSKPSAQLKMQQRQQVWDDFSALPLSDGVQNAYAVLYPHMYAAADSASAHDTVAAGNTMHSPSRVPSRTHANNATSLASHESESALRQRSLRDPRRQSTSVSEATGAEHDRKFWSAVQGYKAIGAPSSVLVLDAKAVQARRCAVAHRIFDAFLHERGHERLSWLAMYADELCAVEKNLDAGQRSLFDALQQTAQLRISTALAQQHRAVDE